MEKSLNFRRQTQRIIRAVFQQKDSYSDLLKEKLVCGKFPLTKTGFVKCFGMLFLLLALVMFVAFEISPATSNWYPYLFPVSTGLCVLVQLSLYLVFSFGLVVKNPVLWVKLDVTLNLLFSILTIVVSIMSNFDCSSRKSVNKVYPILAILGAVIIIISCGGIVLMYRREDDDEERKDVPASRPRPNPMDNRKSVFA